MTKDPFCLDAYVASPAPTQARRACVGEGFDEALLYLLSRYNVAQRDIARRGEDGHVVEAPRMSALCAFLPEPDSQ